jgi:hypothetical protein
MEQDNKSTENRLLAALTHGSVVANGLGILVGVVVYITYREKSRFVAFQGLQAAVYQLINLIIIIGLWLLWGVFYGWAILSLIKLEGTNPNTAPPAIFWISMVSMIIPIIYMVLVALYGLWGAWCTWQGKDFKYLIIGGWLEKLLPWNEDV